MRYDVPRCGIRDCISPAYRLGLCKRHHRLLPSSMGEAKQRRLREAMQTMSANLDAIAVTFCQTIVDRRL